MSSDQKQRLVDQSALKVNQAFIIVLLLAAFVFDNWPIAALVSAVMLLGTFVPRLSLFKRIYQQILKPLNWVRPNVIPDNPEPHLFAQGFGGSVLFLATVSILSGLSILGWVLIWLVIGLASANLFLGFCAGCFLYYQLSMRHVPGFKHSPIK